MADESYRSRFRDPSEEPYEQICHDYRNGMGPTLEVLQLVAFLGEDDVRIALDELGIEYQTCQVDRTVAHSFTFWWEDFTSFALLSSPDPFSFQLRMKVVECLLEHYYEVGTELLLADEMQVVRTVTQSLLGSRPQSDIQDTVEQLREMNIEQSRRADLNARGFPIVDRRGYYLQVLAAALEIHSRKVENVSSLKEPVYQIASRHPDGWQKAYNRVRIALEVALSSWLLRRDDE